MNQRPLDSGRVRMGPLEPGKIYILVKSNKTGTTYTYVRITSNNKDVVNMDILDTLKNKIGEQQIALHAADENVYHFLNLNTGKLQEAIGKQATRQAIDEVYEGKTGQSAQPGTGPADLIRGFVGVQPPKRAGKKTQRNKRSKRTRSRRNR
jgi:hypothetical protein